MPDDQNPPTGLFVLISEAEIVQLANKLGLPNNLAHEAWVRLDDTECRELGVARGTYRATSELGELYWGAECHFVARGPYLAYMAAAVRMTLAGTNYVSCSKAMRAHFAEFAARNCTGERAGRRMWMPTQTSLARMISHMLSHSTPLQGPGYRTVASEVMSVIEAAQVLVAPAAVDSVPA